MKIFLCLQMTVVLISLSFFSSIAEVNYTNTKLGFSLTLPENWQVLNASDSQDIFFDATSDGKTFLSIVHHRIDDTILETNWTRYHFWMYLSVTEQWEDPWGTVLALDSSQSCIVDQVWAPQAFAQFFTLEEEHWSEFIMFTAKFHSGYEIYAIGDTLDLKNNGSKYSQIMQTVTFSDVSPVFKVVRNKDLKIVRYAFENMNFDLFGRLVPEFKGKNKSTIVIMRNKTKFINDMR